jgi:hypothetical protein
MSLIPLYNFNLNAVIVVLDRLIDSIKDLGTLIFVKSVIVDYGII